MQHHGASDAQPFRSSVSPAGTFDPNSQVHQGGHIGLEVTMEPPHAVVAVQDLVDHNFIKQGVAGYSNEPVLPGDRILEVRMKSAGTFFTCPGTSLNLLLCAGGWYPGRACDC